MAVDSLRNSAEGDAAARAEAEAEAHVRAVVRAAKTSFFLPMRLLPPERRQAMYAVYAFCREIDDIADEPAALPDKRRRLAAWREEIEALYGGRASLPTGRALLPVIGRYGLRKADFLALIDGMEMDAGEAIRAPSLAELELYCSRVAVAVGRLSVRVFGSREAAADDVAYHLGQALQLTNILRDLAEDAARGRLYLPRELLHEHGINTSEPAAVLAHPALPAVCEDVAALARSHFAKADAALDACERHSLRPVFAIRALYRRLLDKLQARGWRRLDRRVGLSLMEKLALVVRHLLA